MVWKVRIQYPRVLYDVMKRGEQREALFGNGKPRVSGLVSATGERNWQAQSEAQGVLETWRSQ
jgi:hypothetical protein